MIKVGKGILARCKERLAEYSKVQKGNLCHLPAGSPEGGQFCSTSFYGGLSPLIADTLKRTNDWLLKRQAKTDTEAAVIIGEDGEPVLTVAGYESSVHFTEEDMGKMRGRYLTHNHPGVKYPGLSDQDLVMAGQFGLKGVFCCTEDGSLFGAIVPTSEELPGVIPDIRAATEFARSLSMVILDGIMQKALGPRVNYSDYVNASWEAREELGAAQSYLINGVLHDIGLINLVVSEWGTTLKKADKRLGGLESIRQDISDKIRNPPKKRNEDEITLTPLISSRHASGSSDDIIQLRLDQLNSIYRGVFRKRNG